MGRSHPRSRALRTVVVGLVSTALVLGVSTAAEAARPHSDRLYGADRFATAAAVADVTWGGGAIDTVYVANGMDFPDALAAGPVAGAADGGYGAPVLLVQPNTVPSSVRMALTTTLAAERIVVVGGAGAVSDAVLTELKAYTTSGEVRRVSGSNRYETAVELSKQRYPSVAHAGISSVYIANGLSFPDALAAAPLALARGGVILLTDGRTLDRAVAKELARLAPRNVYVLGGTGAVTASLADAATKTVNDERARRGVAATVVKRLGGASRYDTAVEISKEYGASSATIVVSGESFADALAAGPIGVPILLSAKTALPAATKSELDRRNATFAVLIGGTGVVSTAVEQQVDAVVKANR